LRSVGINVVKGSSLSLRVSKGLEQRWGECFLDGTGRMAMGLVGFKMGLVGFEMGLVGFEMGLVGFEAAARHTWRAVNSTNTLEERNIFLVDVPWSELFIAKIYLLILIYCESVII
jgi:hypothetical protein